LQAICRDAGLGYSIPDSLLRASQLLQCWVNLTDALLDRINIMHDVAV